jgi:nicotinate-nucleotide adenylyltransferase
MLRLATAGLTWCVVDDREIRRGGVSFTVDTLEEYRRENPDATLYWLIGADNVSQLPKWRDARRLAALADFVAIPRPGDAQAPFPAPFRGLYLKGFPVAISSSEIRGRVAAGEPIELLVPPPVAEVIRNNRLYL